MFEQYKVLELQDAQQSYRIKNRYLVLRFAGADSKQKPIYNIVKKFRTEQQAMTYIQSQPNTD